MDKTIILIYDQLIDFFGNQHWWPMDSDYHKKNKSDPRFEVIIGAILTQNTAWSNVEKALINLKNKRKLDLHSINSLNIDLLKELIKPSGFFNQKSSRLKHICSYLLDNYNGDLDHMFDQPVEILRKELLELNGIGPETADSILLYAGNKPCFVVDAYTKRLCNRIPINVDSSSYEKIQTYFQQSLQKRFSSENLPSIYNKYHAIIVELGKQYCKKQHPNCIQCPLKSMCSFNDSL